MQVRELTRTCVLLMRMVDMITPLMNREVSYAAHLTVAGVDPRPATLTQKTLEFAGLWDIPVMIVFQVHRILDPQALWQLLHILFHLSVKRRRAASRLLSVLQLVLHPCVYKVLRFEGLLRDTF